MWHEIVSGANRVGDYALVQLLEVFWRHPWIMSGFLSVLFVLVILFWVEMIKDQADRGEELAKRPILVRR